VKDLICRAPHLPKEEAELKKCGTAADHWFPSLLDLIKNI